MKTFLIEKVQNGFKLIVSRYEFPDMADNRKTWVFQSWTQLIEFMASNESLISIPELKAE